MDLRGGSMALWVLPLRGPNAPWVEDEDLWYDGIKERVVARLIQRLHQRVDVLQSGTLDQIATEVRCQIAEAAVSGNTYEASDLHELLLELVVARDR